MDRHTSLRRWVWILGALVLTGCRGCDPYEQIKRDKARFPPISASRPVGSKCSVRDSASVTRRAVHPRVPTGGWSTTAEVDPSRTLDRGNVLVAHASVIAGYVRFDTEGVLQARVYDDVYGTVYGGWSPAKLALLPSPKPVFVALGRSSYGDGGLSQVHEVCWTPKGEPEGTVVYTSAAPAPVPPLRARQVFRKADLGGRGYFDDRLALQVLAEICQDREIAAARAFLDDATTLLAALPDAVDGTTGRPIPSRVFMGAEWAHLLAFKLGLSVGGPDFEPAARELEAVLASGVPGRFCYGCERYEKLLPLYRWVDARARGLEPQSPDPAGLKPGVHGHDPVAIARVLRGEKVPGRGAAPQMQFWLGQKALVDGDRERAREALSAWLASGPPSVPSGFEVGAAAVLLEAVQ